MNRPSRTEDDLEHPHWNQNPPFLAADLTTCQDLNGIANARMQRSHCGAGNGSVGMLDGHAGGAGGYFDLDADGGAGPGDAMIGRLSAPVIARKLGLGGAGQARLSRWVQPAGWILWVASVVIISTIIGIARDALTLNSNAGARPAVKTTARRLVAKREDGDACAGQGFEAAVYDLPLHVGALFIILALSSLACGFPLLATRFPVLRIPEPFFFAVRHFGTGVLLATAFVHLLPTAFISLGNPCLSGFWTTDYPAMPGAIALVGIFFVAVTEMVFSPARHLYLDAAAAAAAAAPASSFGGHCGHVDVAATVTRSPSNARRSIELAPVRDDQATALKPGAEVVAEGAYGYALTPEQLHKKKILQCMLLEVGILFHSVFIGMALSVAIGSDFVVLLIAIAFHQSFEGLALGARIAGIDWSEKTWQPWLMVLAYGCTTPIGQAIGLATHSLYSPDSEFGLILVGTMNAVSSGLLVFASLIELLAEDFLSDHSWVIMRGKKRVLACFLVFLGAVLMSLVGAWA